MLPDIDALQSLIRTVAREELLPRFHRVDHEVKRDGSILTEADLAVNRRLREQLATSWPDVAFLSEEMDADEQERLLRDSRQPLWVLDPLDGTSNFAAGLPFFGVSLALVLEAEVAIGVVYDPMRDECFAAQAGRGTKLNGRQLRANQTGLPLERTVAVVDFKRLAPALRKRLAREAPYSSQRNFGSCALEWCWMAAGRGHLYLHGGMKLWDFAAGSLILAEAGGHAQTLDREHVFVPAMAPRSVVASPDAALFAAWSDWLAGG